MFPLKSHTRRRPSSAAAVCRPPPPTADNLNFDYFIELTLLAWSVLLLRYDILYGRELRLCDPYISNIKFKLIICSSHGIHIKRKAYVRLLRDNEAEVRIAAAGKVTKFSRILGPELAIQHILPSVKHVRFALAYVILGMAPVLGKFIPPPPDYSRATVIIAVIVRVLAWRTIRFAATVDAPTFFDSYSDGDIDYEAVMNLKRFVKVLIVCVFARVFEINDLQAVANNGFFDPEGTRIDEKRRRRIWDSGCKLDQVNQDCCRYNSSERTKRNNSTASGVELEANAREQA
nr:serine/threonine-protein phosphatase 2A 65 kDa regulatory subunit A beta isoform-like [Tanacetum cinerariifolium]